MAVFTIGSKTLSGSPTGGAVGGASNLTTVGAIPYVSASGVLNQDATNFFWDATNHRLGVGTASPSSTADVVGTLRAASVSSSAGDPSSGSGVELSYRSDLGYGQVLAYNRTGGAFLNLRITSLFTSLTQGNVAIGGTTDGNYKLDVQKSGSTGTLRVYDQTATTGSTLAVIQAGAGQSGNLLSVRNNAGTEIAGVTSSGSIQAYDYVTSPSIRNNTSGNVWQFHDGFNAAPGGYFTAIFPLTWNSDAGIKRSAAGYMAVTDGSTGLGKIVVSQSTPSASTDAGTAGAIWADATYIYVQTAAGTIKRVALTTF